jgi:hypothetical protein
MLVGAARVIINPEIGHRLSGYGPDYPNTGVHDDISATALYLHDGTRKSFLITLDFMGMTAATIGRLREAVSRATGIQVGQVFLACTHVHSGPDVTELPNQLEPDDAKGFRTAYLSRLEKWMAQAACEAKANAEPCDLRYNFAFANENMNRRYTFTDRRLLYIPDNKQLLGQSSEYVDRELGILAFRKKGTRNQYKAIITNYTAHPLCVGNSSSLVSADYQGVLRRHVEETFAGCLCLTTTGAAGDNHPLQPEAGFAAAEAMGSRLAQLTVTRCYDSILVEDETRLRMAYPEIMLPYRDRATQDMLPEKLFREKKLVLKKNTCKTYVSLLGIGPILFTGFPGEPVSELGAMLKWSSPFLRTYPLMISTDDLAYFVTTNQIYWGGYEASWNPFKRGTGELLVQRIVEEAEKLVRKHPLQLPTVSPIGPAKV